MKVFLPLVSILVTATSGYLIPKAMLLKDGYHLTEFKDTTQKSKSDEVGYIFSKDDVNTMTWVLEGKVHVGATNNHHYYKEAGGRIEELEILAQSPEVLRHLVVHSNKLDEDFANAIKEVLMLLDKDESGKAILYEFQKTAKFDEIPQGSIARILELIQLVKGEL